MMGTKMTITIVLIFAVTFTEGRKSSKEKAQHNSLKLTGGFQQRLHSKHINLEEELWLSDQGISRPSKQKLKIVDYYEEIVETITKDMENIVPAKEKLVKFAQGPNFISRLTSQYLASAEGTKYQPAAWQNLMDRFKNVEDKADVQSLWRNLFELVGFDKRAKLTQDEFIAQIDAKLDELELVDVGIRAKFEGLLHRPSLDPLMVNSGMCYGVSMSYLALVTSELSKDISTPLSSIAETFVSHVDKFLNNKIKEQGILAEEILIPSSSQVLVKEAEVEEDDDLEYLKTVGQVLAFSFNQEHEKLKSSGIESHIKDQYSVTVFHDEGAESSTTVERVARFLRGFVPQQQNSFSMAEIRVPHHVLALVVHRGPQNEVKFQFFEPNGGFFTSKSSQAIARLISSLLQHERYIEAFSSSGVFPNKEMLLNCLSGLVDRLQDKTESEKQKLKENLDQLDLPDVDKCYKDSAKVLRVTTVKAIPVTPYEEIDVIPEKDKYIKDPKTKQMVQKIKMNALNQQELD